MPERFTFTPDTLTTTQLGVAVVSPTFVVYVLKTPDGIVARLEARTALCR